MTNPTNQTTLSDSEVNILAAKALGWRLKGFDTGITWANKMGDPCCKTDKDLKFTTSYDWSMLLVKELTEYQYELFTDRLRDVLCHPRLFKPLAATPKQITLAALEVLNGN